jgi:formylglycine-generating enzyme required for sulfatase activity
LRSHFAWASADVEGRQPNEWGLHDMHGNVWEWCQSLYMPYPYHADDRTESLRASGPRALRGGAWKYGAHLCRCASRLHFQFPPESRLDFVGFRVARHFP